MRQDDAPSSPPASAAPTSGLASDELSPVRLPPRRWWSGRLFFGPWWLVYRGPVGPTDPHRHHAVQALFAGPEVAAAGADGAPVAAPLVIPPDVSHRLTGGGDAILVFLDAEAPAARQIRASLPPALVPIEPWRKTAGAPQVNTWADADVLVARLAAVLAPEHLPAPPRHPAVARLLAQLPDSDDTLTGLARRLGLSPSRLSHLFTADVGIPLRAYRRWLRLLAAADIVRAGGSLTDAAHAAGFTDQAHLHRVFRAHFGLRPSDLTTQVEWVLPR